MTRTRGGEEERGSSGVSARRGGGRLLSYRGGRKGERRQDRWKGGEFRASASGTGGRRRQKQSKGACALGFARSLAACSVSSSCPLLAVPGRLLCRAPGGSSLRALSRVPRFGGRTGGRPAFLPRPGHSLGAPPATGTRVVCFFHTLTSLTGRA